MSKQIMFDESGIAANFSRNLQDQSIGLIDERCKELYRVMFATMADILKIFRKKSTPKIAFAMRNENNGFDIGAILTYRAPDEGEEEDSGNWYLEFTFDENDLADIDPENIYDKSNDAFNNCVTNELNIISSGSFRDKRFMSIMFTVGIDTIKEFLDVNATEGEDIDVIMPGVFTASVSVENGIKYMTITPGEAIKQIIKGDSIL